MSEPAIGWIREVVLDSPDPWALARFWAGLLGGTSAEWYPGWVTATRPATRSAWSSASRDQAGCPFSR